MFRILAITATLLGIASAAQADVYRWTDAKGTVQYSDKWVPGSTLVKTDKNHVPPPSAPAPSASITLRSAASSEPVESAAAERDKRQMQQDVAKTRAEQCKKAQEAYANAISTSAAFTRPTRTARRTTCPTPKPTLIGCSC